MLLEVTFFIFEQKKKYILFDKVIIHVLKISKVCERYDADLSKNCVKTFDIYKHLNENDSDLRTLRKKG